eukprot:3279387-Pyramimonas_sp.AAC.1
MSKPRSSTTAFTGCLGGSARALSQLTFTSAIFIVSVLAAKFVNSAADRISTCRAMMCLVGT